MQTQDPALLANLVVPKYLGKIIQDGERYAILAVGIDTNLSLAVVDYPVGSIVQFQLHNQQAQAIELLATAGSAAASIYSIACDYQLTPYFPAAVISETATILAQPNIDDPGLLDYGDKAFCTIDGEHTRDLDQALYLEQVGEQFVIYYALADAAYYVKPGTALFAEALKRGASFYLPGLMIPMLPRELCEGVISLNPHEQRRAVVFELILDATGRHLKTNITRARICSQAKLSFEQVHDFFVDPKQSPITLPQLCQSLKTFQQVGLLRLQLAEERKVARFHRTEINVAMGANGMVFNLLDNVRNEVELYNEQLSVLCNSAGAEILAAGEDETQSTQAIYKTHAAPPADKLAQFEQIVSELVKWHQLEPERWLWQQQCAIPLADYLKTLPTNGLDARIALAINRQALMTNNRSQFSEHADKHYGVGAELYARFSAPMREMVGIFLHKELLEKTGYQTQILPVAQEESLRDAIILAANRAKELQTKLTNAANLLVIEQLFQQDLLLPKTERPMYTGTLVGLKADKLYVLLDKPAIEIKVYIDDLAKLWKQALTVDQHCLKLSRVIDQSAIVVLGDALTLSVMEKCPIKQHWVFQLHRGNRAEMPAKN